MDVTFSLLADAANTTSEGKLNVLGRFTKVTTYALPARHPTMTLVIEFRADPFESGQQKHIVVILRDQDGTERAKAEAQITLGQAEGGAPLMLLAPIPFRDLVFEKAGAHEFVISVNGEVKAHERLDVLLIAQPEEAANG